MDISPEYLRDSSVEVVRSYLKDKVPLTKTVLSIAIRDKLSSEQIKRVVETVNQVAYLKLLESAQDRTFEFPLASYDDIMAEILSPTEIIEEGIKMASAGPLNVFYEDNDLVKEAEEQVSSMTNDERYTLMYREYCRATRELEKLAHEERELIDVLMTHAANLREEPELLEKVAYITDGDDLRVRMVSKLVYGHIKQASDENLFYEEDLKSSKKLLSLLKQAETLVEKQAELKSSTDSAKSIIMDKASKGLESAKQLGKNYLSNIKHPTSALIRQIPKVDAAITLTTMEPQTKIWSTLHPSGD